MINQPHPPAGVSAPALVRRLGAAQLGFDATLTLVVAGLCVLAGSGQPGWALGSWPAVLIYGLALAVRRLCPWAMVALAVAAGSIQVVTASANLGSVVTLAILFGTAGFDRDRSIRIAGLVAVVTASVGGGIAQSVHGLFGADEHASVESSIAMALQIATVAGGAWLVGLVRHQRRLTGEARVAEQIARVEERRAADLFAHEQERTRIARDMHDVVAHTLAVVIAQAEGARYAMARRPDLVERTLRTIAETSRGALGEVRGLLGELRGESAAERGPQDDVGQAALFERMRTAGLDLEIVDVGQPQPLPTVQEESTHWVLTEALTNALKYGAPGRPVTVRRVWAADLEVTVTNEVGEAAPGMGAGHGLLGMRERAGLAGGRVIYGVDGGHFVVRLCLPTGLSFQRPA